MRWSPGKVFIFRSKLVAILVTFRNQNRADTRTMRWALGFLFLLSSLLAAAEKEEGEGEKGGSKEEVSNLFLK